MPQPITLPCIHDYYNYVELFSTLPVTIFNEPVTITYVYNHRSKEVQELISKNPLPSKPSKVLKHALNLLTPRVNGLDSGLDLAVEVSHIDYQATYKYDLVSQITVSHMIM